MDCRQICDDLVARLDGELDARTARRVDDHLATCPDCAAELAALRSASGAIAHVLGRHPIVDVAQALSQVQSALRAEGDRPIAGRPELRLVAGGLAEDGRRGVQANGATRAAARRIASPGRMAIAGALAAGLALAVSLGLGRRGPGADAPSLLGGREPIAQADRRPEVRVADAPPAAKAVVARAPAEVERPAGDGSVAPREAQPGEQDQDLDVPDEVIRRPGLFLDIPIVRHLDKLENMEAVYHQGDAGSG